MAVGVIRDDAGRAAGRDHGDATLRLAHSRTAAPPVRFPCGGQWQPEPAISLASAGVAVSPTVSSAGIGTVV